MFMHALRSKSANLTIAMFNSYNLAERVRLTQCVPPDDFEVVQTQPIDGVIQMEEAWKKTGWAVPSSP